MLMAISQSQNSSLGDLFEVLEVSLAMLLRKMSDILNASRIRPKENPRYIEDPAITHIFLGTVALRYRGVPL